MTVPERLRESEDLIHWLVEFIDELEIPSSDRARIVASCLDVALEHHRSIVLTMSASYHGSAFALVRSEFEAYVRGSWLLHCASDDEIEKFKADKLKKRFPSFIADLEAQEAFNVGTLSRIKADSWDAMNSFAHTGLLQVVRRSTSTHIEANYPDEEVIGTLNMADSTALLAAMGIVNLSLGEPAEREARAMRLLDRMREFVGRGDSHRGED